MKADPRVLAALSVCALVACGGEERPAVMPPSPEAVRTQYGLNPGSCYLYRFLEGGTVYATLSMKGPDTTSVAGRTVFQRTFRRASGGATTEEFFETNAEGEIRLLRRVEGPVSQRVTRRYEDASSAPLFARFKRDPLGDTVLDGERFETVTTPKDLPEERHVWNVLSRNQMAATPDGLAVGTQLQYVRGTETALYVLVPGFGIANFKDFSGVEHQVCAARVCDAQGACTGPASCDDLACSP